MIIQFVESAEIKATDGITKHWFIEGQQFLFSAILTLLGVKYYAIEYEEKQYRISETIVALFNNDLPSTDMRTPHQKAVDYLVRNPIPAIYGKDDVVLAAKELLGQDIAAKKSMDQADYDGAGTRAYQQRLEDETEQKDQDSQYRTDVIGGHEGVDAI